MKKRRKNLREKGLTLIALVVTIIIMLILAGVALKLSLGENGTIQKSKESTKIYDIEQEKECIGEKMFVDDMDKGLEKKTINYIGNPLTSPNNLDKSKDWDIVVDVDNNTFYGDGWRYLSKGTALGEYGNTKYDWVINYETGDINYVPDNSEFNWEKTLEVKDDLLLNVDSSSVTDSVDAFGANTTLYYYDEETYGKDEDRKKAYEQQKDKLAEQDKDGYDRSVSETTDMFYNEEFKAFNFAGNNYIEMYKEGGYDFTNGITFEFYGRIYGGDVAWDQPNEHDQYALFSFWDGKNDSDYEWYRFRGKDNRLFYNLGNKAGLSSYGSWPESADLVSNQEFTVEGLDVGEDVDEDVYITITVDPPNEGETKGTQTVYLNGQLATSEDDKENPRLDFERIL